MRFFAALAVGFATLVIAYPRFFGFLVLIGLVLQIIAWSPLAPLAYAVGWNNPNAVTGEPLSETWNNGFYDLGDTKTLVLKVTNNTEDSFNRIALRCRTAHSSFMVYDESGIRPREESIRAFEIEGRFSGITRCDSSR